MRDIFYHLHLISDSTGETTNAIAKAVCAQFETAQVIEHAHSLVRNDDQVERVLDAIAENPGPVFCSMLNGTLRHRIEDSCKQKNLPFVSVLDPFISVLGDYLRIEVSGKIGGQHSMNSDYFARINALNYTMAHDDGQSQGDLNQADVILTGVSRTSKTPTCMYLANRGIKAANVPLIPGIEPPQELLSATHPLIIGLTTSVERLIQIRRNRLMTLNEESETEYIDPQEVKRETAEAKRLFARQKWPVLDVTRRSIEEVSSAILTLYQTHISDDNNDKTQ